MILELTEKEQITLLGILEDINEVFPIQERIFIKSIIQKLGGTYFGKIEINKIILFSMYGILEE